MASHPWKRSAFGGLLIAIAFGGIAHPAQAQDTPTSVGAKIPGSRAHASELTQAALVAQGFSLESATDGLIVTAPIANRRNTQLAVHASIFEVGSDSARVVLSAIATSRAQLALPGALAALASKTIDTGDKPEYRKLQALRDSIAKAARA